MDSKINFGINCKLCFVDQFLIKLSAKFEVARAALLNRNPVLDLEVCVGELFRE